MTYSLYIFPTVKVNHKEGLIITSPEAVEREQTIHEKG
jgi:hypothetical protein